MDEIIPPAHEKAAAPQLDRDSTRGGVCRVQTGAAVTIRADGSEVSVSDVKPSVIEFPSEVAKTYVLTAAGK
ncbi:MAG TPA: hypothetical protein VHX86_13925 [Tepidisphaeraceae bacterium]|jgi:hypothetical protein|nr:hypothetical protein [Tepidisphaeraceae bacterium]